MVYNKCTKCANLYLIGVCKWMKWLIGVLSKLIDMVNLFKKNPLMYNFYRFVKQPFCRSNFSYLNFPFWLKFYKIRWWSHGDHSGKFKISKLKQSEKGRNTMWKTYLAKENMGKMRRRMFDYSINYHTNWFQLNKFCKWTWAENCAARWHPELS